MALDHVRHGRSRGRGEVGMSLVEALVAMALLLLVSIGVLPLFTRSMVNNAAGSEATSVANHARHRLEELGQLPFNNDTIAIADGTTEQLIDDRYFAGSIRSRGDEEWAAAGGGTGPELRNRTTRVRQFRLNNAPGTNLDQDLDGIVDTLPGLEDDDPEDGEFDDPLGFTVDLTSIHLKEISVELNNPRDDPDNPGGVGPLGAAPTYRLRTFRTF